MLKVSGLQASYGRSQVLFDVDLEVGEGEIVTLLGRNGMGKTTTIRSVMGLTVPEAGSTWLTMPPHLHDRRMEVYFYFGLPEDARIFHFLGRPEETRHLVVSNEQAVISPPWSIHSSVGTNKYFLIWAMAGENTCYTDVDKVDIRMLR